MEKLKAIYTIGYGNRTREGLVDLLKENKIEYLVDVRSYPNSGRPDFRADSFKIGLSQSGIGYESRIELGGYSKSDRTPHLKYVFGLSSKKRIALMCSEMDFKQCHRWKLAQTLYKDFKAEVIHINKWGKLERELCAGSVNEAHSHSM